MTLVAKICWLNLERKWMKSLSLTNLNFCLSESNLTWAGVRYFVQWLTQFVLKRLQLNLELFSKTKEILERLWTASFGSKIALLSSNIGRDRSHCSVWFSKIYLHGGWREFGLLWIDCMNRDCGNECCRIDQSYQSISWSMVTSASYYFLGNRLCLL